MLTALLILSPAINCVNSNYKQLEDVDDPENQIIEVIKLCWSKAADLQCLSSWTLFPRCQSSRTLHYYVSFRIMWTRPTGIGKRAKIVSEKKNGSELEWSLFFSRIESTRLYLMCISKYNFTTNIIQAENPKNTCRNRRLRLSGLQIDQPRNNISMLYNRWLHDPR